MRFALIILLMTCGCGRHAPLATNYLVPPSCIAKAELLDCRGEESLVCKKERLTYKKGCELLVAK
jgi:hypothetical protein